MTAGESADEVAGRAAASANRLEQRAQQARRRAEAFAAGAEGERLLTESVSGLAARGWFMLPDRRTARGGNIDLVLIGPPGVVVLDAKHWSGEVSRVGLAVGRFDRSSAVGALGATAADVRSSPGAGRIPVEPILVLTHETNRGHAPRVHDGVVIVSLDRLQAHLSSLVTVLTGPEIETTTAALISTLAPAGAASPSVPIDGAPEVPAARSASQVVYERFNTYYYVQPWSRGARRRLYLNDAAGTMLAYKDLASSVIAVTDDSAGVHVRDLLANASASGLGLTKATVPKVPADVRGGRLLSSLTRTWMNFHIGHRWRKGSLDRLYCVRADPTRGVDELGYIDLADGSIHPIHDRPLGTDLGTPQRYLELHRDRFKTAV